MERYKQIVVVTGGASGLGLALGREFARRGAQVVLADLNGEGARARADQGKAEGLALEGVALDVTQAAQVEALLEDVVARHGRLDVMVNNAGIASLGEVRDMTLEDWRKVVDVNFWGVVYGSHSAYRRMVAQRSGLILNVASLAGLCGAPTFAAYAATKGAVVALGHSLRGEGRDLGVRVTTLCPGFLQTNIYEASEKVGMKRDQTVRSLVPVRPWDADRAARQTLDRLRSNPALIVLPTHARVLWWLMRFWPSLAERVGQQAVNRYRRTHRDE